MASHDDLEPTVFEDVCGGLKPAIFQMHSAKLYNDDEIATDFENVQAELRPAIMKMRTRHVVTRDMSFERPNRTSKKNVRKKNVIMQDNAGRRRRIITLLERPTRNDNLLAHATPSLVAIAPQSIFVRASEKGAAEDRVTLMKVAEQMFEKRDQEMMTVEPQTAREATACLLNMETARETKETTSRLPGPETAKETEEATACLLNMETARETKETTARLPEPETAKETEEATACLTEPETARETEETTACLPDAEAYQQFCRTWKDLRVPTGAKAPNAVSLLSNTAKSPPSIGVTTARSGK
ncbi:unnamed protein product, partial [Toxocara canis]|uniref:Uncharacterized protein n=1 Tax=Toxocara canis TaxID=6265 RepID=A0A183VCQ4_TOXCA